MITRIEGPWMRSEDVAHKERRPKRRAKPYKKRKTELSDPEHHTPLKREAHCLIDVMA